MGARCTLGFDLKPGPSQRDGPGWFDWALPSD